MRSALLLGLGVATVLTAPAVAQLPARYRLADLKALQHAFVELAQQVVPSIVSIRTYQLPDSNHSTYRIVSSPYSQGTGFVIDRGGIIATNWHVVEGADVIHVILHNGIKYDGRILQSDVRSDLATIKIDAEGLKPVRFADFTKVKVNQWVFAGGNPFGLANNDGHASVTYGVISALGRQMTQRLRVNPDIQYYGNMIETSATINPGSSGGPLFNIDGEIVGVVTAIETSSGVNEGVGFAIPVDKNIRRILETLKAGREVRYGFLGVQVRDLEPARSKLVVDTDSYRGALLEGITWNDGPAAKAGLKASDIVIEYDGVRVENSDHLVRLVGFTPVGMKVPVTFLRNGVKRKTVVAVADRTAMFQHVHPSQ